MQTVQLNFNNSADQDAVLALIQSKYDLLVVGSPVISVTAKPGIVPSPIPTPSPTGILLQENFDGVDGLITNEYAFWNPTLSTSVKSPIWEMTSGSLFRKSNQAWSGNPDGGNPDALSAKANNNCIFRCVTKRKDLGDFKVAFDFNPSAFVIGPTTPAVDWDGAHIFLRYQSEEGLYYASFIRRDGKVVIKKKVPGGPSNGGTYYELTPYVANVLPLNKPAKLEATIKNVLTGVQITLTVNGTKVLDVVDNGTVGGAAIANSGGTGLRGDNLNFTFDNFIVTSI